MTQRIPTTPDTHHTGLGIVQVIEYFEYVIEQYQQGDEPCLFLRSLSGLAQHLNCSSIEIQSALMLLKRQGYDYFMIDMDSPMTFWHPDKLGTLAFSSTSTSLKAAAV